MSRGTRGPKVKPMTPGIPHSARMRAYLAGAVVTLGLLGVAARAWGLQVTDSEHYRELAARQHAINVDIPAPRGEVTDTHGRSMAVSADADSIWANPREIRDVTETAEKLATIMDADAASLEAKLGIDRRFVWLDRHVTPDVAKAVQAAKLPGIVVAREPRRWYPGRTLGGPVIGRADIDGNGLDGIELSMNQYLTGTRGAGSAVRDARGRKMYADGLAQPLPGATVKLTLDRSIQAIADGALADAVTAHKAKSGTVVVLDVATSRVLAMSSFPSYDSNTGEGIAGGARNRPVTDAFEAGSGMKLFTVATALEAGAVRSDSWWDVQGGIQVGPKRFRDVYRDKYLTTHGIIKRSSNVGTIKVAQRLGREQLYAGLKRFGFGTRTGIELPGEQVGALRPSERWREVELATIAFGYGLTVTPLQLAAAVAAIGNGGMWQPPRIVERIASADGTLLKETQVEGRQAVSPKVAAALRTMMAAVFEGGKEGGTASSIVVPGFRCGGKTGTAHKWDHAARMYSPNRYLSSFIGLAPIDKPRLAIVVLIDEPSGGDYYGGKVAGPVFATIASEALRYLGVPGESLICPPAPTVRVPFNPFAIIPPKTCVTPAPKPVVAPADAEKAEPATDSPDSPDKPDKADKSGVIAPPLEPAIEEVEPPPADAVMIPDFRGQGLAKAMETARTARLPIEIRGSGRVVEQEPPPGLAASRTIVLRFSDEDPLISQPESARP
ncbi:MAG: penicillin-binding transpeptidase domain-containing protein [Myxococcota bacterium]|nr:penicillin-binding transpeptidase domain-containing protein [Myxococcota bacterium]